LCEYLVLLMPKTRRGEDEHSGHGDRGGSASNQDAAGRKRQARRTTAKKTRDKVEDAEEGEEERSCGVI